MVNCAILSIVTFSPINFKLFDFFLNFYGVWMATFESSFISFWISWDFVESGYNNTCTFMFWKVSQNWYHFMRADSWLFTNISWNGFNHRISIIVRRWICYLQCIRFRINKAWHSLETGKCDCFTPCRHRCIYLVIKEMLTWVIGPVLLINKEKKYFKVIPKNLNWMIAI